jgi:hypothetical protein
MEKQFLYPMKEMGGKTPRMATLKKTKEFGTGVSRL